MLKSIIFTQNWTYEGLWMLLGIGAYFVLRTCGRKICERKYFHQLQELRNYLQVKQTELLLTQNKLSDRQEAKVEEKEEKPELSKILLEYANLYGLNPKKKKNKSNPMNIAGKLIKKEALKSNYKLTFTKEGEKELFLILHQSKREIYGQLTLNHHYSFSWKRGRKNYLFINPLSLMKVNQPRPPRHEVKAFLFNQWFKKLRLKGLSENALSARTNQLLTKLKKDNSLFSLKRFLVSLFLKYQERKTPIQTEQDKYEYDFLTEITTLFLVNHIYR